MARVAVRMWQFLGLVALVACRRDSPMASDAAASSSAPSSSSSVPSATTDVTTHASELSDSGASVLTTTSGVLDGDALRTRHRARIAHDDTPVTVLMGGSARELGQRICEAKVPRVAADTPIVLKPNLGGFDWFKDPSKNEGDDGVRGRITDPEFVRGVVRCLKARGHTHVTIAEGWGAHHADWVKLVAVSGYDAMAREEGVPLVAMDDDGVFDVEGDKPGSMLRVSGMDKTTVPTLLSPKLLADALTRGMFISLPKIKAHRYAVFSLAIKGTQGTIALSDATPAFRQKWRMHRELNPYLDARGKGAPEDRAAYVKSLETFAERIADVLEVNTPDVVLAEGAPAMQGDGFQKLYPVRDHVAIGGTNVIRVDRVAAEFLGAFGRTELARELGGHTTSPLLEVAAKRFGVDIASRPTVDGDGAALLDAPRPYHFVAMAPYSIDVEPTPRPTVHAASLGAETIHIDGVSDEPAWARAAPISWSTDFRGGVTPKTTQARFVWSKTALYALFEVSATGLNVDASHPTNVERSRLYEEDCVELFLAPKGKYARTYEEIELGPRGHFFDVKIDRFARDAAHAGDVTWSSGVEVKTFVDSVAQRAVIEARIPASEIVAALVAGAEIPLGLFRMEGAMPKRLYLAWSPPKTDKPDFHVFDAFGKLIIDR